MIVYINELLEKEINSGTQGEQYDFKITIEQFAIQFNTFQAELDLAIKNNQLQVVKLFKAAKLQSVIGFSLDDKPIVGIEATSGLLSDFSISFNPTQKQNRDKTRGSRLFQDAILLLKTFERSTTILVEVLVRTEKALSLLAKPTTAISTIASARSIDCSRVGLNSLSLRIGLDSLA